MILHNTCCRCDRPLENPESRKRGYGPVCAKIIAAELNEEQEQEDFLMMKIKQPMEFDVVLTRAGGRAQTNVPWSVIWHSPDGFEWGYGGSGPADLALNILNAFVPPKSDGDEPVKCYKNFCSQTASDLHQDFKWDFLNSMPKEGGTIKGEIITEWIHDKIIERKEQRQNG